MDGEIREMTVVREVHGLTYMGCPFHTKQSQMNVNIPLHRERLALGFIERIQPGEQRCVQVSSLHLSVSLT